MENIIYNELCVQGFTVYVGKTYKGEIDFVAMIDIDDCAVSYRTIKDDIDLGKDVAAKFGGGGHPKAAGSEFSVDVQFKTIEKIFS